MDKTEEVLVVGSLDDAIRATIELAAKRIGATALHMAKDGTMTVGPATRERPGLFCIDDEAAREAVRLGMLEEYVVEISSTMFRQRDMA
jgi:hypothetical protein